MAKKSQREAILDAVEAVIARRGLSGTTIDAVAAEAGVSKGGLFYHFASKGEMLRQLIDRYERRFNERRQAIRDRLSGDPGGFLKATVLAALDIRPPGQAKASNLVSLLDDPVLRKRATTVKRRIFKEVVRGSPHPERAVLAMLVVDGLRVMELLDRAAMTDRFRRRMVEALMELIDHFSESGGEAGGVPGKGGRGGKRGIGRTGNVRVHRK
ncbi:MAG: TetR/AcrR family transcriptional regulator [Planctomycetota bacterium]|jgi:AcrR family transcriptional regulator|nr:TetR/AcrR family transcriptional regulator [Planctomycetota bacterium]